jgi:hypothetical protein
MNKIFCISLVILLLSVESSLQTSIALDRSLAWWTVWLYKIGPLTLADIDIILITLNVFIRRYFIYLRRKATFLFSPYLALCYLAIVYLLIGVLYNLFVFPNWKTFLYDVKAVIFLTIPYLFLHICNNEQLRQWFSYRNIFTFSALSSMIDFIIVSIFGTSEYPSFLGLPTIPTLVPLSVAIISNIYSKNKFHKMLFSTLILLEIMNSINRLSLGYIFNSMMLIFPCIFIVKLRINFVQRFLTILLLVTLTNITSVFMINNPFNIDILEAKTDGAITRKIQMENAVLNFNENIPGIIGKGLGSTWFEYIPVQANDIYSIGTSLGETTEDSLASPVKFIFNWTPPVLIHKWGVLGSISLVFLISRFLHASIVNIQRLKSINSQCKYNNLLEPLLIISLIFIIDNFTFVGVLKTSLITSMLAFELEHNFALNRE